ncbi:MAG: TerB family tellurite resistance protein [Pseudomonadota bacterium]
MNENTSQSDWVLKSMVAMAAADGRLDAREIAEVERIYLACEGRPLTANALRAAVERNTTISIRDELAEAAPKLDKGAREHILCMAYRVLLADNRVAGEERKQLHDMAKALDISEIHLSAILEDLSDIHHSKA